MATRWGTGGNEAFTGTLTAAFVTKLAILPQTTQFVLYVDYAKGTENLMEVRVRYSSIHDGVPNFFDESIMDINSKEVAPFVFKIPATGKVRIPIPVSVQENFAEVGVRAVGPIGGAGTYTLDFVEDKYVPIP